MGTFEKRLVSLRGSYLKYGRAERHAQILTLIGSLGYSLVEDTSYCTDEVDLGSEIVTMDCSGSCNFSKRELKLPLEAAEHYLGAYLVCLHELGHAADEREQNHQYVDEFTLEYEARAWLWALDHSLEPIDTSEHELIWQQLYTYACCIPMETGGPSYRKLIEIIGRRRDAIRLSMDAEEAIVSGGRTLLFKREPDWYQRLLAEALAEEELLYA